MPETERLAAQVNGTLDWLWRLVRACLVILLLLWIAGALVASCVA